GLSLLVTAGWDMVLNAAELPAKARLQIRRRLPIAVGVLQIALLATALSAPLLASALGLGDLQPELVQGQPNPIYEMLFAALRESLWVAWAWAAGAGALILAAWIAADKWKHHSFRAPAISCLMGAMLLADLYWYGYRFSTTKTPREFEEQIYPRTPLVKALEGRTKDGSRFVYHDSILSWAWDQNQPEILFCRPAMHGLPNLRGYDPMLPGRYVEFSNLWRLQPKHEDPLTADPGAMLRITEMDSTRLYDVWNARTILSYFPVKAPGVKLLGSIHFEPDKETLALGGANLPTDLLIYDNPNALGQAWLAQAVDGASLPPAESLARLSDPAFDLRRLALVNSGPCPPPVPAGTDEKVEILSSKSSSLQLRAQCAANRLLVAPISYCRGWRATVNGRPAPVLRVNHAMLGVVMPGGPAQVRLAFLPASFIWGGTISLLAWLVCAGVFIRLKISHSQARRFSVSSAH
ncbi:MAG: YfhO family protein, partial [Candidatus Sumerlaeota bacterium]|nr:YfhO family protein [Candidatus Sumerlaeota bacterium]